MSIAKKAQVLLGSLQITAALMLGCNTSKNQPNQTGQNNPQPSSCVERGDSIHTIQDIEEKVWLIDVRKNFIKEEVRKLNYSNNNGLKEEAKEYKIDMEEDIEEVVKSSRDILNNRVEGDSNIIYILEDDINDIKNSVPEEERPALYKFLRENFGDKVNNPASVGCLVQN